MMQKNRRVSRLERRRPVALCQRLTAPVNNLGALRYWRGKAEIVHQ